MVAHRLRIVETNRLQITSGGLSCDLGGGLGLLADRDEQIDAGLGRRRKLAGILTEASSGSEGLQFVVVGFGINVMPAAYPPDVAGRATSLAGELGRDVDAGLVLGECLAALSERVGDLGAARAASVLETWIAMSPSAIGARVECEAPFGAITGVTAGIAADGALLVTAGGRTEAIRAGPVRWL